MTITQWGTGMVVVTFLAGVLTAGAIALSVAPFKDSGISCGAPVVAAVHGKTVAPTGNGTNEFRVVTGQEKQFLSSQPLRGLSGQPLPPFVAVVCRRPARGRVLVSVVFLVAAALGLVFMARRSDRASPNRQEPAPVPA